MKIKKTYPKIVLLIFSSSLFFIVLYFALYYYTTKVEEQVYSNSKAQFGNEVTKLLELESKPIWVAVNNDTNWDEFVDFIKSKDYDWYNETIGNEISIYDVDYFGAYDASGNFIAHTASPKIQTRDFIPKSAMALLDKTGLSRFYMKMPEGIVEVIGATVHPSDDPLKKTKPFGYFFAVRLMDASFLKNLEKLTNAQISLDTLNKENTIERHEVFATIALKDSSSQTTAQLVFKRHLDVYFENMLTILYIIILAFCVSVGMNYVYSRKWVYYPLELITSVLETGNTEAIKKLKATTGEFRPIGNLFEENSNQKNELINAKLKAEEGDRLKASFLANLSHEIRTPMNAINGFTDLLLNTDLTETEKQEYLKIIDKSGKNLVSIIDDLILMSKIDSNQIVPNFAKVNLDLCIRELYETVKVTIPKNKDIDFRIVENTQPIPYNIVTDEIKLKQILMNLLTNAIKFTDYGHVSIAYKINEAAAAIEFTIQDSGIGIADNHQTHIFDRFKRIENDASIKAGGLGLGLAISKAYAEMLGGQLTLKSAIGIGSVFSLTIPLAYGPVQTITVQPINNLVLPDKKKLTILIAEDDNINFTLFQKMMQTTNYTIIRAVNGLEAVNTCIANPEIDLVLMDIKMPLMDGFEALEKIKEIRSELPIIAQTAYASEKDREKIENAGFSGYLTKPINREKLFSLISDYIQ